MAAPSSSLTDRPKHPAKFSKEIDPYLRGSMDSWLRQPGVGPYVILDPFGGVGGIHSVVGHLRYTYNLVVVGSELEFRWAVQGDGPMIQADALQLPFRDETIDIVCTSPCYGNRMADHHEAKDPCSQCKGTGRQPPDSNAPDWGSKDSDPITDIKTMAGLIECKKCKGTGLSVRNTYRHQYGEPLRPESAATMQWGIEYRNFHYEAWQEVHRVLADGGLFILNVSNHIRKKEVQPVTQWHVKTIQSLGFKKGRTSRVETKRQTQGSNSEARVDHEFVISFIKEEA